MDTADGEAERAPLTPREHTTRVGFGLAKYGFWKSLRLVVLRTYRRIFDETQYVFVLNCDDLGQSPLDIPSSYQICRFASLTELAPGQMECFARRKGSRTRAVALLRRYFDKGGVLWVLTVSGEVVTYQWSAVGGLGDFFVPLDRNEALSFAGETFEEFRGRGYRPLLARYVCRQLAREGVRRVYTACHRWNTSSQRAIAKSGFAILGTARMERVFGRCCVVWSRNQGSSDTLSLL